ncbi:DUF2970 domain-containing protein [Comamonas endophytica]|uniref:DUF2970 domain-containing protein n=1 Tax=Comamonas endophytica TaxID=2949090 RepID=A0ABY6G6Q8_9BURK|nr:MULTISPECIES: DUF2970 domain-containing protein [unclassified Acidovorax]MCD2511318.1 DUF2970 domain-containing protein [Acidovorax sp. D4N7]UYG50712.1 DUF2970 domain-containing protein [Acidovorax sp. 5MLIR]
MTEHEAPKKGGRLRTARAVGWAMLGVRKGSDYQKDVESITPLQVVVGGLVAVVALVAGLILIVNWIV